MKNILLYLLFVPFVTFGQTEEDKFYETQSPIPFREVTEVEIANNNIKDKFLEYNIQVPKAGRQFTRLRQFGADYYLIEFWEQDESLRGTLNFATTSIKTLIEGTQEDKYIERKLYFIIRKSDLENNCIKITPRGYYGPQLAVTTVPFKIRLKDFDFYTSQTLGLALNFKGKIFTSRDFYVNALGGLNLTLINLDSFSTRGVVAGQPINNVGVLSPMVGLVFQLRNVQAGLMGGVDLMNKVNKEKYQWIYNGRPWLGVGLGITILNIDEGQIKNNDLTNSK